MDTSNSMGNALGGEGLGEGSQKERKWEPPVIPSTITYKGENAEVDRPRSEFLHSINSKRQ